MSLDESHRLSSSFPSCWLLVRKIMGDRGGAGTLDASVWSGGDENRVNMDSLAVIHGSCPPHCSPNSVARGIRVQEAAVASWRRRIAFEESPFALSGSQEPDGYPVPPRVGDAPSSTATIKY
ncbi:hypothetical protein DTO027B5_8480 [Paecilomyces variotii]|nr:hypothetical protein DTO027B3_7025 [Paecilomyces variotii]KAJ9329383.1 hypothetical protein DTO027B5_8480 [Paecilomyces variotii]KAJ9349485.1 hypothetical protein DTO027B9_7525 [Paecilomyces variotii]